MRLETKCGEVRQESARTPFSSVPHTSAGLAQLVEHLICNQGVGGSNPSAGTIKIKHLRRVSVTGAKVVARSATS